ncbi:MAG: hypothetical protein ACFB0E_01915 [Leptolyngbyaceae cyanobacterium]
MGLPAKGLASFSSQILMLKAFQPLARFAERARQGSPAGILALTDDVP